MAPTAGYENFVGSKTTHRVLGGYRGKAYYFMEQDELVLRPNKFNVHGHSTMTKYFDIDYRHSLSSENRKYFDNYFIPSRSLDTSNGPVGLLFAIEYFSKVALFGFNRDLDCDKYHYFDDVANTRYCEKLMSIYDLPNPYDKIVSSADINKVYEKGYGHDFNQEKKLVLKLVQNHNVALKGAQHE